MVASGSRPSLSAVERRVITRAAPPSEMELEFAAVTVPSFPNAGLSSGILSKLALNGDSSCSTKRSSLPALIAIGTVSHANEPSLLAFCARSSDATANLSWSSRLNWYFAAQSSAKLPISLPFSGRQHAAHDHFLHLVGLDAGAFDRSTDRRRTELRRSEVFQFTLQRPHWRARRGNNDDRIVFHRNLQNNSFTTKARRHEEYRSRVRNVLYRPVNAESTCSRASAEHTIAGVVATAQAQSHNPFCLSSCLRVFVVIAFCCARSGYGSARPPGTGTRLRYVRRRYAA